MPNNKQINQKIKLKDDRVLGFAEFGDLEGDPVFHFHGHGNSRLEGEMFSEKAKELRIHLIVPDRPGYGLSDFYKRKLLDWPDDVIELADHLNIDKFAVMGISGGGPHTIACTYKIHNRLTKSAIISTIGPPGIGVKTLPRSIRFALYSAKRLPWLYRIGMKKQYKLLQDFEKTKGYYQKNAKRFPKADLELLSDDTFLKFFIKIKLEGFRQGIEASVYEPKLFALPWGFELTNIPKKQNITLWHGTDDFVYEVAKQLSTLIPDCNTKFIEDEGHVSIATNYTEELLTSLLP